MSSRDLFPQPSAEAPVAVSTSEALQALAQRGEMRRFRRNSVLIEEGEYGDTIYIILEGRLRAYSTGSNGREITYGVYGPGEYLGEISLDGGPRSASVSAVDPCTCSVIPRRTLQDFIAERPEFAFDLLAKVIRRARLATLNAKHLALNDVYGRLVNLLSTLAQPEPDGTSRTRERLTHRDLASRLGCSREMVSRLLKDLETGGYIRPADGLLIVLRPLPARW